MKTVTIPVVMRLQDNGDGGWSIYAYNNEDELIADHPLSRKWDSKQKKEVPHELSPKERDDILNEDDPHENGYIAHENIEVAIDDSGNATLAKPLHFHAGQ